MKSVEEDGHGIGLVSRAEATAGTYLRSETFDSTDRFYPSIENRFLQKTWFVRQSQTIWIEANGSGLTSKLPSNLLIVLFGGADTLYAIDCGLVSLSPSGSLSNSALKTSIYLMRLF